MGIVSNDRNCKAWDKRKKEMKIQLTKFIANSGYCSRRKAEELIRQQKVKVNGEIIVSGSKVDDDDKIEINNKRIELNKKKIYIILNKPVAYTCTNRKFKGEKNIFDLIRIKEKLFAAGRLDKDSRGLVLVTNDGDMTQRITHPKFEHEKEYVISITNYELRITNEKVKQIISKLESGIDIGEGDGMVKAKATEYLGQGKFKIILTTGKKRQIRRMFEALDLEVADLVRVRVGSIELGNLKIGEWRYLKEEEIEKLN